MRTYCSLALAIFVFAGLPSVVGAQGPEGKKDDPKDLIIKQLEDASKDAVRKLELANQKIVQLEDGSRDAARKLELANQKNAQLEEQVRSMQTALTLVNEIKAKMAELDKALAKLPNGATTVNTFKKDYSTPPATARVLLANHCSEDLTFYINDTPYLVPAKMTRLVDGVPVGRFAYKVTSAMFGVVSVNPNDTLAPGQTFTLSAR